MTTVLYCGMADDIINPRMAVPDVDTIFTLDRFDAAFCTNGTLESKREDILTILREGHDKLSQHAVIGYPHHRPARWPCRAPGGHGRAEERTRRDEPGRWEVQFMCGGKERKLMVFHQDFYQDWPEEVTDVDHLMSMGAPFEFWDHRDMLGVVEGAGIEWMEKAIKTRHEIGWHEWYAKNSHRIVFDGE